MAAQRDARGRQPATTQDSLYTYDGLYRLKASERGDLSAGPPPSISSPQRKQEIGFDLMGNWESYEVSEDLGGNFQVTLDQARGHSDTNEVEDVVQGGSTYPLAHDKGGNITESRPDASGDFTRKQGLKWDAWNRLVEVRDDAGTSVLLACAYDGLHRRASKDAQAGSTRHFYYSDRWQVLEEQVEVASPASTATDAQYIWGTRHRDEVVYRQRAGEERYGYTPFGVPRFMDAGFAAKASSGEGWNLLYGGQYYDIQSGLYNYGYRYYCPGTGRWPSRDPIGERGGANLYGFVRNDPINNIDYLGMLVTAVYDIAEQTFTAESNGRTIECQKEQCSCGDNDPENTEINDQGSIPKED